MVLFLGEVKGKYRKENNNSVYCQEKWNLGINPVNINALLKLKLTILVEGNGLKIEVNHWKEITPKISSVEIIQLFNLDDPKSRI